MATVSVATSRAMSRAFEDFPAGTRLVSSNYLITADAIMDFGRKFDPQIFHHDPDAAEKTLFGCMPATRRQSAKQRFLRRVGIVMNYSQINFPSAFHDRISGHQMFARHAR